MKPAEFHLIDMETWPRREHYEYYKNLVKTSYNLTAYVDISKLLFRCNETKQRFYPTFVYAITKAVNEINKKRAKDGEKLCEAYVYLPLNEGVDIRTLLRETNVATHPWKGGDWLVNILMNADGKIDMSMLNWVHSISPDCGDTSAWLWGTLNPSRVYTKAKLIEAAKNKEVLEVIANTLYFQEGKELYENAKKKFSVSLTKLKVFPKWFIDKKDDLIQKDLKMSEIMKKFKEFIDMINSDEVENIKGLKKDDNSSKDAKIKKALDRLWTEKIK